MRSSVLFASLVLLTPQVHAAAKGYYRMPTIHSDTIVFAAEGDLWSVSSEGGLARRLTSHQGEESRARISPDGQTLAFSASYEGPTEVYTMPLTGGLPTRRTFEASTSSVVGWTPDGRLIYATEEYATLPESQLVTLDLATGQRERVPLTPASDGVYDRAGRTLFFANPDFHRNNTKRYQGGTARNIWRFRDGDSEARNLTGDFPGENHSPMWWDGRVYYICDRDGTMNIWSIDEEGRDPRQHTRHSGWDVQSASLGQGRIVYHSGADIYLYDISRQRSRLLDIELASDFDQLREKWVSEPMEYLTSAHLHPDGESVALTARGRVFVAPAAAGRLVRVSGKAGVRYRDAVFSSDGHNIITLSDESGELEFWEIPADGAGPGRALTSDGTILRWKAEPSPDGRWIAYSDKNQDLWVLNVSAGTQTRISTNREGIGSYRWSPDSRWLAFEEVALNSYLQLYLYGVEGASKTALTSDRANSLDASFSQDGRFLFFLSDRNLESVVGSPWGPRQPEPYFDRPMKIYQLALQRGARFPFSPKNELDSGPTEPSGENARVDLEGIERRVKEVPVRAGNYQGLMASKDALFWLSRDSEATRDADLMAVSISKEDPKPAKIVEGVRRFELSQNRNKILVSKGESLYVVDASTKPVSALGDHQIDLKGWSFAIDVREDLRQLYVDAWRLERDYFYDPSMHGVDWEAMRDKYLQLVDRITTRAELSDLLGQLVGEISALHVSVRGGDLRRGEDQIRPASLGARLTRDEQAGGYRVDYIYQSDPDYPDELSPLHDPEVDVAEGDVIETINGTPTLSVDDPQRLLRNQQGKQVLLRVRRPGQESREVIVRATGDLADLRYRDWEYTRRLKTEEMGNGEIGYVHLRAMGSSNLTEWYRQFYPVFNRQGLIIDVRHNRGGNIDSIILEKLMRKAWFYWKDRVGQPTWNMQYAFRGHMVVLTNEMTASDGEAFAEGFRRLGLGPVLGTRTWGGEIWLSNNNLLTDGGLARAPQTGVYGPEKEWLIENHGVDPDMVVENLPHATFNGKDAQLEAAVAYLQQKIAAEPPLDPTAPPYPDKSFEYPADPNPPTSGAPPRPKSPQHLESSEFRSPGTTVWKVVPHRASPRRSDSHRGLARWSAGDRLPALNSPSAKRALLEN